MDHNWGSKFETKIWVEQLNKENKKMIPTFRKKRGGDQALGDQKNVCPVCGAITKRSRKTQLSCGDRYCRNIIYAWKRLGQEIKEANPQWWADFLEREQTEVQNLNRRNESTH